MVFVTVIRIVMIVGSSLKAVNEAQAGSGAGSLDGAADNSAEVLRGALTSMLLTLGLALLAFIAVTQGVNLLYSFATGFTNDITAGGQVNAIEKWLGKGSIFTVIMLQVQNFAKIGIVLVGGVILLMRKSQCRFLLASWRRREQKTTNRANRRLWRFLMRQMAHAFEGHPL